MSPVMGSPVNEENELSQEERLAIKFHFIYEKLAPSFGYETRKESAKPWREVPENNRQLMIAVCKELLEGHLHDKRVG